MINYSWENRCRVKDFVIVTTIQCRKKIFVSRFIIRFQDIVYYCLTVFHVDKIEEILKYDLHFRAVRSSKKRKLFSYLKSFPMLILAYKELKSLGICFIHFVVPFKKEKFSYWPRLSEVPYYGLTKLCNIHVRPHITFYMYDIQFIVCIPVFQWY